VQCGDVVAHLFAGYATPDRAIAEEVSEWLRYASHEPFLARDLRDTTTTNIITALRTARAVEQTAAARASAGRAEHYLWDDKRLTTTLQATTLGDSPVNQARRDLPITTRQ
jgi:hypothetical protein